MSKIELCPEWNLMCICRKGVRKKGRKGGRKERSEEERTERQMAIACKKKKMPLELAICLIPLKIMSMMPTLYS